MRSYAAIWSTSTSGAYWSQSDSPVSVTSMVYPRVAVFCTATRHAQPIRPEKPDRPAVAEMVAEALNADGRRSRRCPIQGVRAAILIRLWVKIPCPVQVFAPSRLSRRLRSQPYPRLRVLIRPAHPVRHLMVRRNAGRFSTCWRAAPGRDLHQRRRVRHPGTERDPAKPLPGDRIGHFPTQRLVASR